MASRTIASTVGIAGVLAGIALGVYALGSPGEQRARRLDERRVEALQGLSAAVDEYWRTHARLPASFAELTRDPRFGGEVKDPSSGHEYGFQAVSDRMYRLCAEFARATSGDTSRWPHPAGPHCFDLEAPAR